jgi:low affinity Fe/Cu permease
MEKCKKQNQTYKNKTHKNTKPVITIHKQKPNQIKNAQAKMYETKSSTKMSLSSFCVDQELMSIGPILKCDLYSQ